MTRETGLEEESVCPVWAMVKSSVEVTTAYKIIPSGTKPAL
jgi:uncharacterized OsmC-like protein